jgi:5-methylcytosine-specific restriction protein A
MSSDRKSARERGYTRQWEKARRAYLSEHPLCVLCRQQGRITAATVVDHIEAHRGDEDKFWNEANWQSLCVACHARKTALEDGAFGHGQSAKAMGGCDPSGWPTNRNHAWLKDG